jgi:hypothetical protein
MAELYWYETTGFGRKEMKIKRFKLPASLAAHFTAAA